MKRLGSLLFILVSFLFAFSGFAQTSQLAVTESDKAFLLTDEIIHKRVKMYLLQNYLENHEEIVFEIEPLKEPIPVDPVDWDIRVDSHSGVRNGLNSVVVTVFSKNKIYKKFPLTAKLRTFDDVVMAQAMIPRGEIVQPEQLRVERFETTNLKRNYFTLIEDVANLQASRTISPGKPVFTDMVELPDIIHRGDLVKIVVKLKNMQVTATGKALEDGKKGQVIKVENQATGKKIMAEVVDEKTVIVEL